MQIMVGDLVNNIAFFSDSDPFESEWFNFCDDAHSSPKNFVELSRRLWSMSNEK